MMSVLENTKHAVERAAVEKMADELIKKLNQAGNYESRSEIYVKIVDLAEKFYTDASHETFERIRTYVSNPGNRWIRMINHVLDDADPQYVKSVLLNLGYEAFFCGTKKIRENRKKYDCNIPWLILFDPTMACNMHCKGCWSGTYG
ncbi:MAG TPA: pyrroloquinoline quinone biosynthesis protein PqqE, partial [Erysipelotrichaceae bacterium]|nr:pyrroloquinoline quinone biosynthesis protein PqqE [Erysipelotrichaceae bacterium]